MQIYNFTGTSGKALVELCLRHNPMTGNSCAKVWLRIRCIVGSGEMRRNVCVQLQIGCFACSATPNGPTSASRNTRICQTNILEKNKQFLDVQAHWSMHKISYELRELTRIRWVFYMHTHKHRSGSDAELDRVSALSIHNLVSGK